MNAVLENIIEEKKKHVAEYKAINPIERFEQKGFFWKISNRSLVQQFEKNQGYGIIAEFKRKSPSKGWFKPKELEVEKVLQYYNQFAAGVSVLTDEEFFGGDLDDLIQSKVITDIPVLRKDFIIDKWQIAESKAFGADIILLIAACLTPAQVKEFASYANSIGLESILEIHTEKELGHICDEVSIIGVNNRDLQTFQVSLDNSLYLVDKIPGGKPLISESGIGTVQDILILKQAGFNGFLVGEQFMKQADPGQAFFSFIEELKTTSL